MIVTCTKSFDYITEGFEYEVSELGKSDVYLTNVNRGGGTFIPLWKFAAALNSAMLVIKL
jgi:hypothetical protein